MPTNASTTTAAEPLNPDTAVAITLLGFRLANRAVVSDIESEGYAVDIDGVRWWDIRPMFDVREHSPEVVDMSSEAMAYALASGLVQRHATQAHLVRINGRDEWTAPMPQQPTV